MGPRAIDTAKLVLALLFVVVIFLFYGVCFWLGLSMNKNEGCGAINNDFAIGLVLGLFTMLAMLVGQGIVQLWAKAVAARQHRLVSDLLIHLGLAH